MATAGRHLAHTYLVIAGAALALVVSVLAIALVVGAHPDIAASAGRWVARVARTFNCGSLTGSPRSRGR